MNNIQKVNNFTVVVRSYSSLPIIGKRKPIEPIKLHYARPSPGKYFSVPSDLSRFFSFLILYTVGRTPSTGISPSQGLYSKCHATLKKAPHS
jgi:hypothetical protein